MPIHKDYTRHFSTQNNSELPLKLTLDRIDQRDERIAVKDPAHHATTLERKDLIYLMYRLSKKPTYIKCARVNTRGNVKTRFNLMSKCTTKYLNSPLYRGSNLWDILDKNVQDMPTLKRFVSEIVKQYKIYVDLIN